LETNAVTKHDSARNIVEELQQKLAELDAIGAEVAAAHLDSAIQALRRQFQLNLEYSDTE
jgi:hypothetical protein